MWILSKAHWFLLIKNQLKGLFFSVAGVANNNWYLLKIPDFFWVEKMVDKKTKKITDLKLQSILNVNTNILLNFLFSFVSLFY